MYSLLKLRKECKPIVLDVFFICINILVMGIIHGHNNITLWLHLQASLFICSLKEVSIKLDIYFNKLIKLCLIVQFWLFNNWKIFSLFHELFAPLSQSQCLLKRWWKTLEWEVSQDGHFGDRLRFFALNHWIWILWWLMRLFEFHCHCFTSYCSIILVEGKLRLRIDLFSRRIGR